MRSSAPAGSPTRYTDPKTIDGLLESSDPEAVAESGRSYQRFAAAYEKIAGELLSLGSDLHDAWSGKDAAAAQSQLREVWSAAVTVHKTASTFGIAVERHGSESLAWYKYNKPPSTDLAEAQSWMTGANERVSQSWSSLPADLATTLPPSDTPVDGHTPPLSDPSDGGGTSAGSVGHGTSDTTDLLGSGTHKAPVGGSGSQLAGLPSSGTGGIPGGGLGTPTVGGPGGTVLMPPDASISGPGTAGVFGQLGGGGLGVGRPGGMNPQGPRNLGPGRSAISASGSEAEANAMTRSGTGPVLGGSAAGREERERTRKTWLAEDEDIWTGDVQAAPGLIGTEGGVKAPEPKVRPVEVEIDLTGEHVDLTDILSGLNPSVPKDAAAEIAELKAKLERLERQVQAESGTVSPATEESRNPDWITGGDG
jgi:hypothetical protein